jgi:hypothetical protein
VPQNDKSQKMLIFSLLQINHLSHLNETTRTSRVSIEERLAFCEALKQSSGLKPRIQSRGKPAPNAVGAKRNVPLCLLYKPNKTGRFAVTFTARLAVVNSWIPQRSMP